MFSWIDSDLFAEIKNICCGKNVTLSAFMYLAFAKTLMEISGKNKVCFFTTWSGRENGIDKADNLMTMSAHRLPFYVEQKDKLQDIQEKIYRAK